MPLLMGLSDVEIRNAKARSKSYKMFDERGLFLLVTASGSKYWRFRYYFAEREKQLALGVYPEISLKVARDRRDVARKLLEEGTDPSEKRKTEKLLRTVDPDETFEAVARDWHKHHVAQLSEKYAAQVLTRLENDLFPKIGRKPISQITAPELLAVLRKIEDRGALVSSHTMRSYCSRIFRFAIALGKAQHDIAHDLRGALKIPNRGHYASLAEEELPDFLRSLAEYDGDEQTQRALQLVIYTLVRTTEMRGARKEEFDFKNKLWVIPKERMKMGEKHLVPLSDQALALFREQFAAVGNSDFLFPNRHQPKTFISENTLLFAVYRMGYHNQTTVHGFRSTGSTILNEHGFHGDHVERQLAHAERNKVRAAYNYAEYIPQRALMMQWWADYVDLASRTKSGSKPTRVRAVPQQCRRA